MSLVNTRGIKEVESRMYCSQESDVESPGQVHGALEVTGTEGPWVLTLIRLPVTPPSNGVVIAEDADPQGP